MEFFYSETLDRSQEIKERISDLLLKNKTNFYPPHNRNKFLGITIGFINQQN